MQGPRMAYFIDVLGFIAFIAVIAFAAFIAL